MKKLFYAAAILIAFASCKSNQSTDQTKVLAAFKDSVEYAEFLKWKQTQVAEATTKPVAQKETKVVYRNSSNNNSTVATTPQKKGWSKSAKGAVIGGAGGAVVGAVVNKRNRGAGAVIGGVIGAGVGYGIGRGQDKRDGRIQ